MGHFNLLYMKSLMRIFSLFFICWLLSYSISGKTIIDEYDGDKLPNLNIKAFAQDQFGYMWIGTARGLCKYNGYSYHNYLAKSDSVSLNDDCIEALFIDNRKNLWIATRDGIYTYKEEKNNFQKEFKKKQGILLGFLQYGNTFLVYGTQGIQRYNNDKQSFDLCYKTESNYLLYTLTKDNKQYLWGGEYNGKGIICLDRNFKKVKTIPVNPTVKITCSFSHGKEIFFGSNQGLIIIDSEKRDILSFPESNLKQLSQTNITSLTYIGNQQLLIGTENDGIYTLDINNKNLQRPLDMVYSSKLEPNAYITSCYQDKSSNIWFGTFDKGFNLFDSNKKKFNPDFTLRSLIKERFITRIVEDGNRNLWIGTYFDGLLYYDRKTKKSYSFGKSNFPFFQAVGSNFIQDLFYDSNGRLWVSINNHIAIFKTNHENLSLVKDLTGIGNIVTMCEDNQQRVWTGSTLYGINIYDSQLNKVANVSPFSQNYNNITKILRLSENEMAFSSYNDNIYRINTETLSYSTFRSDKELPKKVINLFLDSRNNIWMGTYATGAYKYQLKDGRITHYTTNEGLSCNDIVGFEEDNQHNIWISTSLGLSKFSPKEQGFTLFYDYDGISGNQFHDKCSYKTQEGEMFFGGNEGITHFLPVDIQPSYVPIPVILEDLKLFNHSVEIDADDGILSQSIPLTQKITLTHKQNVFSIDFAGIDFGTSQKINYAYKLQGFDKDWNYVNNYRRASYSNLPPGKYTFYVKAQNKDGIWNNRSNTLSIRITPSPWQTPIAYICYFVVFIGIAWLCIQIYIKIKLERARAILAEQERDNEKLLAQMKTNFFSNISHELRTPLSLIYGPIKLLNSQTGMKEKDQKAMFDLINFNIKRLLRLIDQILDFNKLESDALKLSITKEDVVPTIENAIKSYSFYAHEKNLTLTLHNPFESLNLPIDSDKLDKILHNLISNAIKYTPQNGHIDIDVQLTQSIAGELHPEHSSQYLKISVSDDGAGMAEEDIKQLFTRFYRESNATLNQIEGNGIGLNYVQKLVKLHKGDIIAHKETGMVFTFVLPTDEAIYDSISPSQEIKQIDGNINLPEIEQIVTLTPFAASDTQKHTLLIVEDNPEVRLFLTHLFADKYNIHSASNGLEGYNTCLSIIPDIVISDVIMPQMNGYELCNKIKEDDTLSQIPVVLLTARTTDQDQIEGYSQGADKYVNKPFNPLLLTTIVENILVGKERQRGLLLKGKLEIDQEEEIKLSPIDQKFMDKLYAYINEDLSNPELNVNSLGTNLGYSRSNFYRKVKTLTGQTPNDFLRIYRLNKAGELIQQREYSLSEVGERVGFINHSHFSTSFKKHFGVSPKDYLNNKKEQ